MLQLYPKQRLWFLVRSMMVLGVVWVLAGLWIDYRFAWLGGLSMLQLFWMVLVPAIVLVIYFAPMLWRNSCPLSTVSLWRFILFGRRKLSKIGIKANERTGLHGKLYELIRKRGLAVSALLFWGIVPYRLLLFNGDSHATFWLIVSVFGAAFIFGALFPVKSGWCTSICPMAAAEKAYGMNPAKQVKNTRCHFYNQEQGKVMSCSGCSFNCWDVVEPEHAYWQQSTEKIFHDTLNAEMRKIFVGTLPGFMLAFFLLANKIVALPAAGPRVLWLYFLFALAMSLSYFAYAALKRGAYHKIKWSGPEDAEGRARYAVAKRKIELSIVTLSMNIILFFLTYAWAFTLYPKLFGENLEVQGVLWSILLLAFFSASMVGLRSGWNEKPGPGNYRPNWW